MVNAVARAELLEVLSAAGPARQREKPWGNMLLMRYTRVHKILILIFIQRGEFSGLYALWGKGRIMDGFWHDIFVVLFGFLAMSLGAFITWKRFFYEYKQRGMNEKKRKRANRRSLIFLLILANSVTIYILFDLINRQFFAS